MYKPGVKVRIRKEPGGYGAHAIIRNTPVDSYGRSLDEVQARFVDAMHVRLGDEEHSFQPEDINFTIDFRSFFDHYKVYHSTVFEADDWDTMEILGPAY
jgi:hypothetical protein